MVTEFYGSCNCERVKLNDAKDVSAFQLNPEGSAFPFAILLSEVHTVRWCAVLNSGGGMFQLKYGDQ